MTQAVYTERIDRILRITLDRPKANAIDTGTSQALYEVLAEFEADPELWVAILTGAGKRFFSAGWDLNAAAAGEAVDVVHSPGGFAGLTEYFSLTKPVIGAINGLAVGGGFELALACDLLVAAGHAEFFLPETGLGIVADSGGVFRLPHRLPRPLAMEMLFTGRRLRADEALKWGLVNQVVPADELQEAALTLARRICESAPLAIRATKELVQATEALSVPEAFRLQRSGTLSCYHAALNSEDAQEGPRAFAGKRTPVWKGR